MSTMASHIPAPPLFAQLLAQAQIKENIKVHVTGLCAENSPVTGESPAQKASNMENVSIWWCHHVLVLPIETHIQRTRSSMR